MNRHSPIFRGPAFRGAQMPTLWQIVPLGQTPDDSIQTRRLKAMSTIVVAFVTAMSASMFLEPDRSLLLRMMDLGFVTAELTALYMFWRSRSVEILFLTLIPPYLALMTLSLLVNGTTEGDYLTFLIVPIAAAVVLGPSRSFLWFSICFAIVAASVAIAPFLPDWQTWVARSGANPTGSLFFRPTKDTLASVESQAFFMAMLLVYFMFRSAITQLSGARSEVEREKSKVDRLMASVYPARIVDRLKAEGRDAIVEELDQASVLFADLEGFTEFSKTQSPKALVAFLDRLFNEFDRLADLHGVEKIKTMGDGYLAAAGLSGQPEDHAGKLCALGIDMIRALRRIRQEHGVDLDLRIGVQSGSLIAGVLGRNRPHFDIWGGTVNMAHRLQATSPANCIQISAATRAQMQRNIPLTDMGEVEMKGLGRVACWLICPLGCDEPRVAGHVA